MVAVNEINVRVPGRAEQDGIAVGPSHRCMSRRIVGPEVGFYFDDASGEKFVALAANEDLAQQIRADKARVTVIE